MQESTTTTIQHEYQYKIQVHPTYFVGGRWEGKDGSGRGGEGIRAMYRDIADGECGKVCSGESMEVIIQEKRRQDIVHKTRSYTVTTQNRAHT